MFNMRVTLSGWIRRFNWLPGTQRSTLKKSDCEAASNHRCRVKLLWKDLSRLGRIQVNLSLGTWLSWNSAPKGPGLKGACSTTKRKHGFACDVRTSGWVSCGCFGPPVTVGLSWLCANEPGTLLVTCVVTWLIYSTVVSLNNCSAETCPHAQLSVFFLFSWSQRSYEQRFPFVLHNAEEKQLSRNFRMTFRDGWSARTVFSLTSAKIINQAENQIEPKEWSESTTTELLWIEGRGFWSGRCSFCEGKTVTFRKNTTQWQFLFSIFYKI